MHSFESQGFTFLHNGDCSGEIRIVGGSEPQIKTDLAEIMSLAFSPESTKPFARAYFLNRESDSVTLPMVAVRSFAAYILRSEAISRLEQMQNFDVLSNPYLRSIAEEMSKS